MGLRFLALFAALPLVVIQTFRRPHFGVYVFCALTLVRVHELVWGFAPFRLLLVVSIVTLVAWLAKAGAYEGVGLGESPPLIMLTLFLAFAALSAAFAVGRPDGVSVALERVGKLGKILLFCFLMQKMLDDWERVDTFVAVWLAGTLFLAAWGIQQHFLGNVRLEKVGGGDTNGSNELGALFVLMLPIALQRGLIEERALRRAAYYLLVPILIVGIAFTGSRAAFLGFAAAAAILFFITRERKKLVRLALPLVPVVAVLSGIYFTQRVETIENYEEDWSAVSRLYFWRAAANMAEAHPAMGVGPANYPLCCADYGSPEAGRDCHSTYFTMLAEVGLPGFALWIASIGAAVLALDRVRRAPGDHPDRAKARAAAAGLEAGVLAFLIVGFFNSFGYYEYLYWPIALGQCLRGWVERLPLDAPDEEAAAPPEASAAWSPAVPAGS